MAGALVRGLTQSGAVRPDQLQVSDVDESKLAELKRRYCVATTTDNRTVALESDIVVIAVKPQVLDRVLVPISTAFDAHTLVVSIAAGVPIALLESKLPPKARVVRAMPNTAAIALASATAIAGGSHADANDLALAKGSSMPLAFASC